MAVEAKPESATLIPPTDLLIPYPTSLLPDGKSSYRISETTNNQLIAYVADLEWEPRGERVGKIDFTDTSRPLIDPVRLRELLPEGLSEEEFYKAVRISNLIECATLSYVGVFVASADRYGARWLRRFATHTWGPDELEHADPFKLVLLQGGYCEEELDREALHTEQKIYEHTSGDTPVQMTGFGLVQEEITAVWHGLIGSILRKVSPELAREVIATTGREHLHKMWYTDQTMYQIMGNPELRHLFTDTLTRFKFPGEVLIPDLYEGAIDLIPKMGGEKTLNRLEQDFVRLVDKALSDGKRPEYLGETVLGVLEREAQDKGLPLLPLIRALSRTPGLGRVINTFTGQLIRERVGLNLKIQNPIQQMVANLTQPLRSAIIGRTKDIKFVGS